MWQPCFNILKLLNNKQDRVYTGAYRYGTLRAEIFSLKLRFFLDLCRKILQYIKNR